ncbi:MAG: hypothetical protein FJW94_05315 [Actinobacteria bacterium]|nr:hypothetical protein [Actinomycetota bacterium]
MSTILKPVTDVQERIVQVIGDLKQPVTKVVSTVVDFVTDRRSEFPAVPFAEKLPTPVEVIDNQAKFATNVVRTTKSVATAAAKAAAPVTDQLLDRSTAKKATVAAA